jgi:glycosyltransferase involved in cell wall biosynthesis
MLRGNKPCYENVGGIMTEKGAQNLLDVFRRVKPDVFLFWATYMNDGSDKRLNRFTQLLVDCRKASPKTKILYGNGNQQGFPDYNIKSYMTAGIDGILSNTRDAREAAMYRKHGIPFFDTLHTFGFDPVEHGPAAFPDVQAKWDCFFGGSQTANLKTGRVKRFYPRNPMLGGKYANSKARLDFIREVDRRFKLVVYGKGKWPVKNLRPYAYGRKYPKALRTARILLNMYHWDLKRYYTKRTIFSGASGRPLICKYIPGMEKDFTNGKNLVWFKTVPEALDKIKFYLKNNKERAQLAVAQREHFVKHHSWEARLGEFEGIVERLLG